MKKETWFYTFRYYIMIAISFGFTSIPLIEMPNHLNDYGVLSELVSILVSPLVFCLKVLTFKNSKPYFIKLLQNIKQYPVDESESDMLNAIKLSKRLIIACPACYMVAITTFLLKPVLDKADLPVKFSYNLGKYKNVMYAYQVLGLGIIGIALAFFDCLVINFINIGLAKLEILARRIKNTSTLRKDLINKEFSEIVDEHDGLIQ